MMKQTDYERMLAKTMELIKGAVQPGEAMRALIDLAAGMFSEPFLTAIRHLSFNNDVDQLERWLTTVATNEPVPDDINAYWFGLFNPILEGAPTSCLYVAGSNRYTGDEEDEDWACGPAYFPEGRYSNSSVLKAIYRAYEDCAECEGEYFCLWYAAIAVPMLFHRLSDQLLGQADRRAVAIGFDSGDVLMLGTLTTSGFEPLEYAPPCVPTIRATPSDAEFYEIEDDPRGRWWLEHPVAANGDEDELPFGIGTWCEPIEVETPLLVATDADRCGAPVGFTFTLGIPIVRENVGKLIESLVGKDVQLVPVKIAGHGGQFWLLNILRSVKCLDLECSDYALKDGRDGPLPGATAESIRYVRKAVIDLKRAGTNQLFRFEEASAQIIVGRDLKTKLELAGVTGIKFKPLKSV